MEEDEGENKVQAGNVKPKSNLNTWITVLVIAVVVLLGFNMYQSYTLKSLKSAAVSGTASGATGAATYSGPDVIPKGVPEIYGKELGVSFDDVSATNAQKADATIRKLGGYDQSLTLSGNALTRYINIVSKISCEYCCGAQSIIFNDGKPACGCAHSFAMRGLAKYLLTKHASEYTDDQILEELGKWKTLFFPGQISAKAEVLQSKSVELNYINLASNKYRGIEKQASASGGSGMVGGC